MAQHIIRDSKGRAEKILNDQEYAEYQKTGCLTKIFLFIIFIIVVIAIAINGDNNDGKDGSDKIEKTAPKESSQLDVSTTQSNAQKEDAYSKQQPSAETTPLLEADIEPSSESVEAVERESQDIDVSSMSDDPEQEQHLSRKERRALRKAQKRLEKEMEKESQDIELSSMTDDPEQEQHLSRKERRALRKAQKRLQKEMEKEND